MVKYDVFWKRMTSVYSAHVCSSPPLVSPKHTKNIRIRNNKNDNGRQNISCGLIQRLLVNDNLDNGKWRRKKGKMLRVMVTHWTGWKEKSFVKADPICNKHCL